MPLALNIEDLPLIKKAAKKVAIKLAEEKAKVLAEERARILVEEKLLEEKRKIALNLFKSGMNIKEISKILNIDEKTIENWLK